MLLKFKCVDPHDRWIALRPEDIYEVMQPHPAAAKDRGHDPASVTAITAHSISFAHDNEDGRRLIVVEGTFDDVVALINKALKVTGGNS